MNTNVSWISDPSVLGTVLSQELQNVWANRTPQSSQYYVSLVQGVGNPSFDNELTYAQAGFPTPGINFSDCSASGTWPQYFYPNRDIIFVYGPVLGTGNRRQ